MDEQQRQRLGVALHVKRISFREAVRLTNAAGGELSNGYVRELVRRGRGTKENLEKICAATGVSFDFVWRNIGDMDAGAPNQNERGYLTVSRADLKKSVVEACLWFGARASDARAMAELVLTKLASQKAHD